MDSEKSPIKVLLWTLPRSLSTVLCRCLGAIDEVQIVFEPYRTAYHDGPDANKLGMPASYTTFRKQAKQLQMSFPNTFEEHTCSFAWVKHMLEKDVPGKSVVFAKDFAYCVHGRYESIARGYHHAFLIRNPYRVFPSFKKMKINQIKMSQVSTRYEDIPKCLRPPQNGYKEMYDLYQHVHSQYGVSPIIIDADDLQRHSGPILNQFCRLLAIPFTDKHLQWTEGEEFLNDWIMSEVTAKGNSLQEGGFFSRVSASSGFHPPSELPSKQMLSEDLHSMVDESMPFYEKLFSLRLKPFT